MTNISLAHFQSAAESAAISGNLNQKLTVTDSGDLQTREASSSLAGKLVSWHKLSSSEGTAKAQDQGAFRTALQDKFGKDLGEQAYKHACSACGYTDGKAHSLTAKQISTGIDFAVRQDLHKQGAVAQNKDIIQHFANNPNELATQGIVRVPGVKSVIDNLVSSRNADALEGTSAHALASTFKQNLRDNLTEADSRIVLSFVEQFKQDNNELPQLGELPELVQDAVHFAKMVEEHKDANSMKASNLGICFGPSITKDDGLEPMAALALNQTKTQFFTALITLAD
ncbi:RhoGAP domain-containing protein [Pseudovibrio ascidiaceicola]|uniref:RhoGAP domain-containing protein n=1 Tax=Pseudovibrio ascidiaceicola TaxID=285279 RepID=A0A1I3YKK2_9HYPH|nr:Rho GTPase-activating protein [Pseudovibrio ascidiaceicola]SFK32398.1 RhoGAP domain-containing protein [Pseudovibrio ascidiaceicola]